jgi:hypothetical protein
MLLNLPEFVKFYIQIADNNMKRTPKKILISFVGSNDSGNPGKNDGAVLTALGIKSFKFDKIHIIYSLNVKSEIDFYKIAKYVETEIKTRSYCKDVALHPLDLDSVIDHNEIYNKLLALCISLKQSEKKSEFTALISSGTPAMMVCWILMAESGDFKIKLFQVTPPRFSSKLINEVKLDTSLPRIKRLEEEVNSLLPEVVMNIAKGQLFVDKLRINLSPKEFCFYRYFLEQKLNENGDLRISGFFMPDDFKLSVIEYLKDSFEDSTVNLKKIGDMMSAEFRPTLTKLNTKFRESVSVAHYKYVHILGSGPRMAKSYSVLLKKERIKIT